MNLCNPNRLLLSFYVSLRVLMHWYTCIYLLNTLESAVEQLAVHLSIAKQATVSSRGQSTTVMQSQRKISREYLMRDVNLFKGTPSHVI